MRKYSIIIFASLLFLLTTSYTLFGGEYVIQPGPTDGQDVWITNVYYDGGLDDWALRVGGWGDIYSSLIRFDVSNLPSNIISAKLYLYHFDFPEWDWGDPTPMYFYKVTSNWDENTKWLNRPSTEYIGTLPAPAKNTWYSIDITELYKGWVSGSLSNYGIYLEPTGQVYHSNSCFYSSDYMDDPSLRPILVVSTDVTVPGVAGMDQVDAEDMIYDAGLVVGAWDSEYNACVPIGHIIRQNPSAGTVVDYGSPVDLTTSLGTLPSITCVPYLVGMSYQAARNAILSAGLGIGAVTQSNSATVPSGCVISQGLAAYTSVAKNTSVGLNISLGPVMVTVPNVVGTTQASAQSTITSAGLTVGTVTQAYSTTVAAGNVISQSPFASTSVVAGTSVNLTVSRGPQMVTVPNVVGMTYQAARSAILSASLGVGSVNLSKSDTVPSGYVISQGLAAGTSVAKNSPVGLNVSTGK